MREGKPYYDKLAEVYTNLAAACRAAGAEAEYLPPPAGLSEGKLIVNDHGAHRYVDLSAEKTKQGWRSVPNGKYRVKVGWFGETKQFPEKADGSFSYDKMAEQLILAVRYKQNLQRQVDRQSRNEATLKQTREDGSLADVRMSEGKGARLEFRPTSEEALPVQVTFQVAKLMTVEQAKAFEQTLKQAGLI